MFSSRPHFRWAILIASTIITALLLVFTPARAVASYRIPQAFSPWRGATTNSDNQHLPLPSVYTADATESKFCLDRFSHLYLENLRSTSIQYCGPPSTSSLTCFHSHTSQDDFRDSMCIGDGAVLQSGKFALDCEVRPPDASEVAQGLIPFESMRSYWYDTGPRYVFDSFVQLGTLSSETATQRAVGIGRTRKSDGAGGDKQRFFALLVKREGDVNPWHCLMEVFSMGMTFDVLRMSRDPANNGKPFFNMPEDMENTQVIILDDRDDGPYFDLWRLFSGRDPVRLADIQKHPDLEELLTQNRHRIIVPLAGASNTIWQNDWAIRDCKRAELLDAFVRRVPGYYGIEALPPSYPEGKDIRITFIDRKDSRRLKDQESLFAALRGKYPTVDLEVVDFAALPFPEQIRIAGRIDILVGVHGAALTHTMFMRKGEGAIVEIHPSNMSPQYRGFQNLANMMGLGYFDTHAINTTLKRREIPPETSPRLNFHAAWSRSMHRKEKRQDWHIQDFEIDVGEFVNLVGVTVRSLYNKGGQAHDMV